MSLFFTDMDSDELIREVLLQASKVEYDRDKDTNIKRNFSQFEGLGRRGYYRNIPKDDLRRFIRDTLTPMERDIMIRIRLAVRGIEHQFCVDGDAESGKYTGTSMSSATNESTMSLIFSSYELEYKVQKGFMSFFSNPTMSEGEVQCILDNVVKKELVAIVDKELPNPSHH